jgi:ribosomal-protein-alanine N-acetyltransferase
MTPLQIQQFVDSLEFVSYYPMFNENDSLNYFQNQQSDFTIFDLMENGFCIKNCQLSKISLPDPSQMRDPWNRFLIRNKLGSTLTNVHDNATKNANSNSQKYTLNIPSSISEIWWCLIDKETKRFAGMTGFNHIDAKHKKAEYVFWILPDFRGNSYLTEGLYGLSYYAFNELNIHRVDSYVISENKSCERAFLKSPFRLEGRLENFELVNDEFVNYNLYAMINPNH